MTSFPSSAGGSYSYKDLRGLYPSIGDNHLRYLEKWGLLSQTSVPRDRREYSFADLLTVKHLAAELEKGTPLRVLLRTLASERQGQLELDFNAMHAAADTPRAKVIALDARKAVRDAAGPSMVGPIGPGALPQPPYSDPQAALAAKYFLEGSRLDDGDERKLEAATVAYRKALVVDPDLVPALVNLANIHYSQDRLIEAQALYERAITIDPDCFEAHFNLGNIQHDLGRFEGALVCYRDAVEINPTYPDAHFYLAVTLEKTGHSLEAKPHWKAYQELAPTGEWAELAKEFLE
ncbi:MAG TPA: tetratricopeptide repeat protein [Vicinamibacterales bacterium]